MLTERIGQCNLFSNDQAAGSQAGRSVGGGVRVLARLGNGSCGARRLRRYALAGASWIGVGLLPAGCMVGPNYRQPDLWSPTSYAHGKESLATRAEIADSAPDVQWWSIFHDEELSKLEQRVAADNLDVQEASADLAESRAQLLISGAGRFPSLNATGSYSRNQYSSKEAQYGLSRALGANASGLLGPAAGDLVIPQLNMWQDAIDASYEVDLWGRVARETEAARAQLDASAEARRSVLIARLAEMARDYMSLRGAQAKRTVLQNNLRVQGETVNVSRDRYRGGLVSELDVISAQAQYDETTSEVAQYDQQIAQQINAICLLLGLAPGALDQELSVDPGVPSAPPRVPVGVPSELARRRPDIREAEARLHAATAEVGEAVASFYPKVTIDAGFGFQSLSFRDLGFWSARAWNVGPSISLPIFQGGQLRGQLALNKAAQKAAAITYRETVLGAWRDVDNALIAYRKEQARHDGLQATVRENQRSVALASEQYHHGLVNYLNVLNAQNQLLQAQLSLADSTTTLASNTVQLYNALGGGWESSFPDASAQAPVTTQ